MIFYIFGEYRKHFDLFGPEHRGKKEFLVLTPFDAHDIKLFMVVYWFGEGVGWYRLLERGCVELCFFLILLL